MAYCMKKGVRKERIRILRTVLFILLATNAFSAEIKGLMKTKEFPKNEFGLSLGVITDIEILNHKIYAVENNPQRRILVFSEDGQYLKAISKEGYNEGELKFPILISAWNKEIAVHGDSVFSFFKEDGTYLRRFNAFIQAISFVYVQDKTYMIGANRESKNLIEVFTKDGDYVTGFGEKFIKIDYSLFPKAKNHPWGMELFVYRGNLLTDGENLYYLNSTFGKALKYSLGGERLVEKDIVSLFGVGGWEVLKENERQYLRKEIEPSAIFDMFMDAYLCGNRIYMLEQERVTPDEYASGKKAETVIKILDKRNFDLLEEWKVRKNENESLSYFATEEINGEPIFYFTQFIKDKPRTIAEYRLEK
jgi:hypothetical protein